jgi:Glyoxalase-like domain
MAAPEHLPLDHVVIAVPDLAAAMADWRGRGFQVLPGGRHPGRTSHNALICFADGAYLELIAWQAPAPQERWWRTLQADGEGLVDFALLPQDTMAVLQRARARGLDTLVGPVDGGRVRPDGERLQWRTARHATPDLPFLCGDITPRRLRVPDDPALHVHPNGSRGVASLSVLVEDIAITLGRYCALLGGDGPACPVPDQAQWRPDEGLWAATLPMTGFSLTLLSPPPGPPPAGEPETARALRQRLAARGEGPCALELARRAD